MKRVYETGERLSADMVGNIPKLTKFAQQEIGVDLPLGNGRRQGWYGYCKKEMAAQGWNIQDLVLSVQYIKRFHKVCRSPQGILFYVGDAKAWNSKVTAIEDSDNLHVKVADAIKSEDDEGWVRRLSLAQGEALRMVYQNWLMHAEA
jgi:hypothetical protein